MFEKRMISQPAPRQGLKVLLVDDSATFIEAATLFLEDLPWIGSVEIARSAEEAIVFAAHYRPQLVLMDYEMPGASGLDALRAIKSRAGAPPVVVTTLHDPAFLYRQALKAGADGFVSKHELFIELPKVLERLFGHPFADRA
jgi:DNA-binding NarL/FixJ family response regulator